MKQIPGYKNYYATKTGVIFSDRTGSLRKMQPTTNSCGYLYVTVRRNNKQTTASVHGLVARAHIGKTPRLWSINHKNGIKTDNRAINLEIIPHKQNIRHAITTGLRDTKGTQNPNCRLSESDVMTIKSLIPAARQQWGGRARIAKRFRVTKELIYALEKGQVWAHLIQPTGG